MSAPPHSPYCTAAANLTQAVVEFAGLPNSPSRETIPVKTWPSLVYWPMGTNKLLLPFWFSTTTLIKSLTTKEKRAPTTRKIRNRQGKPKITPKQHGRVAQTSPPRPASNCSSTKLSHVSWNRRPTSIQQTFISRQTIQTKQKNCY